LKNVNYDGNVRKAKESNQHTVFHAVKKTEIRNGIICRKEVKRGY
jgi:hypothetical protein